MFFSVVNRYVPHPKRASLVVIITVLFFALFSSDLCLFFFCHLNPVLSQGMPTHKAPLQKWLLLELSLILSGKPYIPPGKVAPWVQKELVGSGGWCCVIGYFLSSRGEGWLVVSTMPILLSLHLSSFSRGRNVTCVHHPCTPYEVYTITT